MPVTYNIYSAFSSHNVLIIYYCCYFKDVDGKPSCTAGTETEICQWPTNNSHMNELTTDLHFSLWKLEQNWISLTFVINKRGEN